MNLINAILSLFYQSVARGMERRSRPEKIRAYIRLKEFRRPAHPNPVDRRNIRVCAVQEQIGVLSTYQAYADRMHAFVQQAVDQGAQLVCFPEENGTLLLGQLPLIRLILRLATGPAAGAETKPQLAEPPLSIQPESHPPAHSGGPNLPFMLSLFSPFLQSSFEATFSELARGFGVYIMAGSLLLVENGRLYNRAALFDPQGHLAGVQDKAHPVDLERTIHLACAGELKVFDTRLGRLALPVCMDATYFETFKILKQLGAELVLLPIANLEEYDESLALRGIWPRVQESGLFGVKSALVGDLYGLRFTGKAGIYAPLDLTPCRTWVIAEAATFNQDEIVTASLDLTRLETYVSDYFSDTNPALYRRYFPGIYQNQ